MDWQRFMQVLLPIGAGHAALEISQDRLVATRPSHGDNSESDGALLRAAVTNPLGYPPLRQAILPGDHVTIAVDPELPQLSSLINELLSDLLEAGCEAKDLTLLVARSEQREELHGDTRLATLREQGMQPDALVGLLAQSCGLRETAEPCLAAELINGFDLQRIKREPFVWTEQRYGV